MLFSGTGAAALPAVGPGMAGAVGGDEVRWKKINELITRATANTPTATKSRNLRDRGSTNWMDCGRLLPSSPSFEFLGRSRIAKTILVEIDDVEPQAVFRFALPLGRVNKATNADIEPNPPPNAWKE